MSEAARSGKSAFATYLDVTRRQFPVLAAAIVIAALFSMVQTPQYEAQAQVTVRPSGLGESLGELGGAFNRYADSPPDRFIATHVEIARTPQLAGNVLEAVREEGAISDELTTEEFLASSAVEPTPAADVLIFKVTNADVDAAVQLATAYAQQYTSYLPELDRAWLDGTIARIDAEVTQLQAQGGAPAQADIENLTAQRAQIQGLRSFPSVIAQVISEPDSASQVAPRTFLNLAAGILLGAVLGVGLAVLRETLDTRVRSSEEISRTLGIPLLARLPTSSVRRKRGAKLVMLDDSETVEAETFRFLRTNFSVANLTHGAKTVMITSAIEQEGKSTVTANLALALARAGSRVALVDLDLRRPGQRRLLDLPDGAGFTEVALGKVRLERAVHRMTLVDPERSGRRKGQTENGKEHAREFGYVEVLTTGDLPRGVGEFVGSSNTVAVLEQLRSRVDVVLIDAPPMLRVGDASALLPSVDAVLLVTRLNYVRRTLLVELRRTLKHATAPSLGVVVTGVPKEETFTGAYGTTYEPAPRQPVT
jgi:Mrp family chromosome partitioning ATPase/capsular polysaccharide biosynthesis protein